MFFNRFKRRSRQNCRTSSEISDILEKYDKTKKNIYQPNDKMSTEIFYPIKRIVRRNTKGVKRPFLIEWLTEEPSGNTWEPWYNLSETLQKQYYKNGKKKNRCSIHPHPCG